MNQSDVQYDDHWADLNSDLLDEIMKHVNYGDYIRLHAVCKNWSLELPKNPKHAKNPWLVLPFDDENEIAPLFNLAENINYKLELPEIQETVLRGSCYGWLITIDINGALQILNPFTRAQFDLPSLATFPDVVFYRPHGAICRLVDEYRHGYARDHIWVDKNDMQRFRVRKIITSAPPNDDDQDVVAIAIYSNYKRLAWCKLGDSRWTKVPGADAEICRDYEDAIFCEGKIFVVDQMAQLFKFDMKTGLGGITESIPPNLVHLENFLKQKYLAETPDGLIMVIRCLEARAKHVFCSNGDFIYNYYQTVKFEIYKLNGRKWLRMNNLGNHVLLLGQNSSLCTTPDGFPDGKGNQIYFTDDRIEFHSEETAGSDVGVFNFEDESINHLYKDKHYIWPPPVWLLKVH